LVACGPEVKALGLQMLQLLGCRRDLKAPALLVGFDHLQRLPRLCFGQEMQHHPRGAVIVRSHKVPGIEDAVELLLDRIGRGSLTVGCHTAASTPDDD
jgi:hypothetical protein